MYGMKPSSNEDGNGRDPERSAPLIHVDEIFMSKIGRYQTVPTVVVGLWKGESELDIFVAPPRFITVLKMFRSRFSSFFLGILYPLIGKRSLHLCGQCF